MRQQHIVVLVTLLTSSCASWMTKPTASVEDESAVTVMTYNVENLFDTLKDENREDYAYLPRARKQTKAHKTFCEDIKVRKWRDECFNMDWSEATLYEKLTRISDVIRQVKDGKGPDVLILEEVENKKVLDRLVKEFLPESRYKTNILIEGPDKRGIDVAFLSRFEIKGKPTLHEIPFVAKDKDDEEWMRRSRGILEVTVILPDGELLTVFGVHFPSHGNPRYWREQAISFLNKLQEGLPNGRMSIAGGDFNIVESEEKEFALYKKNLGPKWLISHEIGCSDCPGTNYYHYKDSWSFLDALLFSKNMHQEGNSKWEVIPQSVRIPNNSRYQVNRWLTPARFNPNSPVGVSDHWPVLAQIRPRREFNTEMTSIASQSKKDLKKQGNHP